MPLGVYVASLDGAIGYWDTGEAQVVPWIFGIAHPTGFPVFTIAAGIFAHVFAIGTVAWRIALFSAIAMSVAAWAIYRILRELDCDAWIAVGAAWIFAFGEIAWTRGTRAEVHALAACFAALTLYAAVRWRLRAERRSLILGALCWGLGIATHPIVALLAPALVIILCAGIRRIALGSFALALAAFVCGLAFYAYLPIRSAIVTQARLDPTRRLGEPPGKAFWDMEHPAAWSGFKRVLSGTESDAPGAFAAMLNPQTYRSGAPPFFAALAQEFTPFGLLFALAGVITLARRNGVLAWALIVAGTFPAMFAFGYVQEADIARYYLIPFIVVAVFAGFGASGIARTLPAMRTATILAAAGVAIALLMLGRNIFTQPASAGAEPMIRTVVSETPDGAVLLAPWLDSTALAYAAYVDGSLGRRIVESAWLADDALRVPRWLREGRSVYVVDQVFGSVPGYRLVKISGSPNLYRIVKQ